MTSNRISSVENIARPSWPAFDDADSSANTCHRATDPKWVGYVLNIKRTLAAFTGPLVIALAVAAYGQQSTPPPATDFAPAAPAATSASPTTDTAAPPAGVTSGAGAATSEPDDRPNEQSASAASPGSTAAAAPGAAPPTAPAPASISPLDRQLGSGVPGGSAAVGQVAGQPGELGVWMVERDGPGVPVTRITQGSAADLAGLQTGDVILQVNQREVDSPYTVARMIRQIPAGQAATVQFWRDGQTRQLEIVLQPVREPYEVGFRGEDSTLSTSRSSGDLEQRTLRLEQRLSAVEQELRQLRLEIAQLRGSGSATAIDGGASGVTPTTPAPDAAAPPANTPAPATQPAPAEADLFNSTAPPATTPAADEATPETTTDDLFD